MRVFRICQARQASSAFTGDGAVLYPGRWHPRGVRVVYASESRALAALEQLVHLHRTRLPDDFVCFTVDVPEALAIREVLVGTLPAGWRRHPGPPELQEIGSAWISAGDSVCLKVPSAVVPGEHNILLNPRHADFSKLVIGPAEPFAFDERLRSSQQTRAPGSLPQPHGVSGPTAGSTWLGRRASTPSWRSGAGPSCY
jgi:RES domain-containing protein